MLEAESTTNAATTVSIHEPADSAVTRYNYKVKLTDASGQPVAGEDVILDLEGDGSFAPGFFSGQIRRETNASGETIITWYRRSIFGRDVKATITVRPAKPEHTVSLEQVPEAAPKLEISYVETEFKIRKPRA